MTALPTALPLASCVERACARVAPTWPLDRFIAVQPFWGRVGLPMPAVSAELAALSGARLLMPRAFYKEAWLEGRLRLEHLRAVSEGRPGAPAVERLVALLDLPEPRPRRWARVMDVADRLRDLSHAMSWRDYVVHTTSQHCAAFFDEWQAELQPDREGGLYASWRRAALRDRSPALAMGLRGFRREVAGLPGAAEGVIAEAAAALGVSEADREAWLTALLLDLGGWAAWCAYRRWTARQRGEDDDQIVELLAVRAAWELVLYRCGGPALAAAWAEARAEWPAIEREARAAQAEDWYLQRALERAYAEPLLQGLPAGLGAPRPSAEKIAVQAVFCIDVRSEPYRRALESVSEAVQTLGFAGFFGLPVEHLPLGAASAVPLLPGLLAPSLRVTDVAAAADAPARRADHLAARAAWGSFQGGPVSAFSFVESLGLGYAAKLLREVFAPAPLAAERAGLRPEELAGQRPRLCAHRDGRPLGPEERVRLAASILRGMSLTRGFARIVLLVGHGSAVRNNPHRAGLDCGACCGSTGEINAAAAAALLNEEEVRAGLAAQGLALPPSTRFLAALHDTTTDELRLLEEGTLPASHAADLAALRGWLAEASARARAARLPRLGEPSTADARRVVRARATDWAETRPEWGLAGNAAFIAAPREHLRHLDLAGRAFLHEYRHEEDPGYAVLETILTAPVVVAHWINLQYYASTVDNQRYGSGNKVLHNVVGGHIGVFEGNGGDLRVGLPLQSLHDGRRWVHTPLRLHVLVEAPREAIEGVLARQPTLRQLVENEWLYLFQVDREARAVRALGPGG